MGLVEKSLSGLEMKIDREVITSVIICETVSKCRSWLISQKLEAIDQYSNSQYRRT